MNVSNTTFYFIVFLPSSVAVGNVAVAAVTESAAVAAALADVAANEDLFLCSVALKGLPY